MAGKFRLPLNHRPYMVLPVGGTGPFSCARCTFMRRHAPSGTYYCTNAMYQEFMGESMLRDEVGEPLDDPSRACSDWFQPRR